MRFYPDKLEWVTCNRCGEPKLPHRICTANIEICAMREDEFVSHKESNSGKKDSL